MNLSLFSLHESTRFLSYTASVSRKHMLCFMVRVQVMVINATFNNISAVLVEETRVPVKNHRPAASH
jgi:hypothetical protein